MTAPLPHSARLLSLDVALTAQIAALRALLHSPRPPDASDQREVVHVILRCEMAARQHRPQRKEAALRYAHRFHEHVCRKLALVPEH